VPQNYVTQIFSTVCAVFSGTKSRENQREKQKKMQNPQFWVMTQKKSNRLFYVPMRTEIDGNAMHP